ncbi:MAG: zinc finger-like domain-containing protein [Gemmatimonadaceae bacterium]|nr:zinc finger-like domain-containing protein [Gemmatimonadaceae bacterium]
MTRIEKLHGPVVPDPNWERAGTTPEGRQLYIERTPRTRAVPDYEDAICDACEGSKKTKDMKHDCPKCDGKGMIQGKRRYAKNPLTGEPLYPKNKAEHYVHERMFFIDSDGQGNQVKIDWSPPTPEQIRADLHARAVADMIPRLAGALVDSGLDMDEIVDRLTAPKVPEPKKAKGKPVPDANPDAESVEL